jgi:hypothetical protein
MRQTAKGRLLAERTAQAAALCYRGALLVGPDDRDWLGGLAEPGWLVVFGNDGYPHSARSRAEARRFLAWVLAEDLTPALFGASGGCWALALRPGKAARDAGGEAVLQAAQAALTRVWD